MCAWRQTASQNDTALRAAERRGLGLLLEGAAIHQFQIDPDAYRRFRSAILRHSIALAEPMSETDLLDTISASVHEFEIYRADCELVLEARQREWRHLARMLMHQLAERDKIDPESESWGALAGELAGATGPETIQAIRSKLEAVFRQSAQEIAARQVAAGDEQDRSTANDNASGLRGGGAAIEHARGMIAGARPGYVCLFRLNCLDVVGERFGAEGIQDCLMAVSAFLAQNMRTEDTIYHWSESSLLAVCDRKIREDILSAELNRILARNREFTINIGDRAVMLRIPIDLQLYPIAQFASAEDLLNLASGRKDRGLPERAASRGYS